MKLSGATWDVEPLTCTMSLERLQKGPGTTFADNLGNGKLFQDASFPAAKSSLYWDDFQSSSVRATYKTEVSSWKRPSELKKGIVPSLFGSKGIRPAAVNQGMLGDCWFLAAIAAVAEWPERVNKIFTNTNYDAEGIFEVNLTLGGKQQKVVVDDRLPYKDERRENGWIYYGQLIDSNESPNNAFWVPILEKAGAKYFGNYEQLEGGNMIESLYMLTGMPGAIIDTAPLANDALWKIIKEMDDKHWIMTASNTYP